MVSSFLLSVLFRYMTVRQTVHVMVDAQFWLLGVIGCESLAHAFGEY